MRISSRTMVEHVLANLQRNYARLDRLQNQLSTGKQVIFPSDDPAAATTAMRLHTAVLDNEQYVRNVQSAVSWLEATDSALQDITSSLHRVRELTIYAARDDLPADARAAIADELDQLVRHVGQVGNSTHGGRFVFAGTQTNLPTAPYELQDTDGDGFVDVVRYYGDGQEFGYEVGPDVVQAVNLPGTFAFDHQAGAPAVPEVIQPGLTPAPGTSAGLFGILMEIRDDVVNGRVSDLSGEDLGALEAAMDRVLQALDRVGARQEGFELIDRRLSDQEVNLKSLLSQAEDLDVAKAITELKMQENVYSLALASGARIIQPTLLEFLK